MRGLLEIVHSIIAHLDILEHYLKFLGELEPAFFFKLQDQRSLEFLLGNRRSLTSRIKQPFAQAVLVETLENILVLEVSKDLDDTIKPLINLRFCEAFEFLLELVVKVVNKTHRCLVTILVQEVLKCSLDCQIYLAVLRKALRMD